jgi:hypothetical protein
MMAASTTDPNAVEVGEALVVNDKAYIDYSGSVPMLKKWIQPATTTVPPNYPVQVALTPGMRVNLSSTAPIQWVVASATDTGSIEVAENIAVGDSAFADNVSGVITIKKYVASAVTPTVTPMYYATSALLPAFSFAYLDNVDGKIKPIAAGSPGAFEVSFELQAGDMAFIDYATMKVNKWIDPATFTYVPGTYYKATVAFAVDSWASVDPNMNGWVPSSATGTGYKVCMALAVGQMSRV